LIAFRSPSFRWLLASSVAASLCAGLQLTAVGWLALSAGGGALTVGVVLAARSLPNLLFGLASGTLADHTARQQLLVRVRLVGLLPPLGLTWLAVFASDSAWLLVVLTFATGAVMVFETPTRQALVMDTTPPEVAANAMALNATVTRVCMALGALAAGAIIPVFGVPACFLAATIVWAVAAALALPMKPERSTHWSLAGTRPTFREALAQAARLALDFPEVRVLLLAAIACEIFGFSYMTAVPVFARDVLGAGAEGLGTLNAAASAGGAAAVVVLSLVPGRIPRQPILGLVFLLYGLALLALAPSTTLAMATAALAVIGACAASFDVLQQTLMQLAVPEHQRGRAVGLWVLGIGSAPVGNLEMGALITVLGGPAALAINGALVLTAVVVLALAAPAYRGIRIRTSVPTA
jgi:MFS family permease